MSAQSAVITSKDAPPPMEDIFCIARQGGSNNSKAAMLEAGCKTGFFDGAQQTA